MNDVLKQGYPLLNHQQRNAVDCIFQTKSLFLTGVAGTGKTTVLKTAEQICNDLRSDHKAQYPVYFTAMTGKAASFFANGWTLHNWAGVRSDKTYAEFDAQIRRNKGAVD